MTLTLIILVVVIILIYYYYKKKNLGLDPKNSPDYQDLQNQFSEVVKVNKIFASFCQNEIGGKDIEEIRTKLNGRKLSEILEQNEDYELEVDTLTRTKNELETDLLAQSNSFKSLIKEKEGIIKRLNQEKSELVKDLSKIQDLAKIQHQKISDLEAEVKKTQK